jgi:hypothetical protein
MFSVLAVADQFLHNSASTGSSSINRRDGSRQSHTVTPSSRARDRRSASPVGDDIVVPTFLHPRRASRRYRGTTTAERSATPVGRPSLSFTDVHPMRSDQGDVVNAQVLYGTYG